MIAREHPERQAIGKNLLWQDYYDSWITDVDTGFCDGLHAFVLYGGFTALGEKQPKIVRDGVELWRADPIRDLTVHDGGGYFGLELTLPHRCDLEPGLIYRFDLPFAEPPDEIVINERLVWRRNSAVRGGEAFIARFDWRADGSKAVVRLLTTRPDGELRFISPGVHRPSARLVSPTEDTPPPPTEERAPRPLPATVRRFPLPPLFRQWLDWNTRPAKWVGLAVTVDRHAEFVLGKPSALARSLFPPAR